MDALGKGGSVCGFSSGSQKKKKNCEGVQPGVYCAASGLEIESSHRSHKKPRVPAISQIYAQRRLAYVSRLPRNEVTTGRRGSGSERPFASRAFNLFMGNNESRRGQRSREVFPSTAAMSERSMSRTRLQSVEAESGSSSFNFTAALKDDVIIR